MVKQKVFEVVSRMPKEVESHLHTITLKNPEEVDASVSIVTTRDGETGIVALGTTAPMLAAMASLLSSVLNSLEREKELPALKMLAFVSAVCIEGLKDESQEVQ